MSSTQIIALLSDPFTYLATLAVVCSILVVTMQNLFRASLALAAALSSFAFIYFSLNAGFVAVIQVLLYTSTIAALLLFVIMLIKKDEKQRMIRAKETTWKKYTPIVLSLFVGVLVVLMVGIFALTPELETTPQPFADDVLPLIGEGFLTTYLLPFELVSFLLFVAVIGALILARKKDPVAEVNKGFDDEVNS